MLPLVAGAALATPLGILVSLRSAQLLHPKPAGQPKCSAGLLRSKGFLVRLSGLLKAGS